jgi:hypothetical protein
MGLHILPRGEAHAQVRPAQLPKLSIRFDGWRSGRWRAADARPSLGGSSSSQAKVDDGLHSEEKRSFGNF